MGGPPAEHRTNQRTLGGFEQVGLMSFLVTDKRHSREDMLALTSMVGFPSNAHSSTGRNSALILTHQHEPDRPVSKCFQVHIRPRSPRF